MPPAHDMCIHCIHPPCPGHETTHAAPIDPATASKTRHFTTLPSPNLTIPLPPFFLPISCHPSLARAKLHRVARALLEAQRAVVHEAELQAAVIHLHGAVAALVEGGEGRGRRVAEPAELRVVVVEARRRVAAEDGRGAAVCWGGASVASIVAERVDASHRDPATS